MKIENLEKLAEAVNIEYLNQDDTYGRLSREVYMGLAIENILDGTITESDYIKQHLGEEE